MPMIQRLEQDIEWFNVGQIMSRQAGLLPVTELLQTLLNFGVGRIRIESDHWKRALQSIGLFLAVGTEQLHGLQLERHVQWVDQGERNGDWFLKRHYAGLGQLEGAVVAPIETPIAANLGRLSKLFLVHQAVLHLSPDSGAVISHRVKVAQAHIDRAVEHLWNRKLGQRLTTGSELREEEEEFAQMGCLYGFRTGAVLDQPLNVMAALC
mmetsp:Transcript_9647/g.29754  ORF Transcript_9647/g.29754 Transcript_9647/m.29754 type:complete len:209 (-) Transcript_9647:646-1272(-)